MMKSVDRLGHRSYTMMMAAVAATVLVMLLTGCGGFSAGTSAPAPIVGAKLSGTVYGGQQPVGGASLYLYAASTAGYAAAAQNVLSAPVQTTALGNFNLSSFTCTAGQQMYLVAVGGNPGNAGGTTNPNLALMAALGDCTALNASLNANGFISINELTTVAAGYALAPFASGYANVGSTPANSAGLTRAFVSASKLANSATGKVGGPALAAGAVLPAAELNTLADILAYCVNSTGGAAGSATPCGQLFTDATPAGGTAPGDTIAAILAIAQHPTNNVALLYGLAASKSPYQTGLGSAPADWTVSINYATGGFNAPQSATVDAGGQVWFANSGNATVSVLAQTGSAATPLSGNGLNAPAAVAIDQSGNAWVANKAGNTLSEFTNAGAAVSGSPFSAAGNLNGPVALAFDAPGNLWIANNAGNSLTEVSASGTFLQQVMSGVTMPTAVAIDPK